MKLGVRYAKLGMRIPSDGNLDTRRIREDFALTNVGPHAVFVANIVDGPAGFRFNTPSPRHPPSRGRGPPAEVRVTIGPGRRKQPEGDAGNVDDEERGRDDGNVGERCDQNLLASGEIHVCHVPQFECAVSGRVLKSSR